MRRGRQPSYLLRRRQRRQEDRNHDGMEDYRGGRERWRDPRRRGKRRPDHSRQRVNRYQHDRSDHQAHKRVVSQPIAGAGSEHEDGDSGGYWHESTTNQRAVCLPRVAPWLASHAATRSSPEFGDEVAIGEAEEGRDDDRQRDGSHQRGGLSYVFRTR